MSISDKQQGTELLPSTHALLPLLAGRSPLLIAIDGMCCSGKSTLGAWLADALGANLFHMDDFFLQPAQRTEARLAEPGGNVDRERVLSDVLLPLRAGSDVLLRRYDCRAGKLLPAVRIPYRPVNLVEGSYAAHPALAPFYDVTVALSVSEEEQRRRILLREPPACAERFFTRWIPLEQRYFDGTDCFARVQYRIDVTGEAQPNA